MSDLQPDSPEDDVSRLLSVEEGAPIRPISLTFQDPELEREYWARFYLNHRVYFRAGSVVNVLIQAAYGYAETFLFPDYALPTIMALRYLLLVPVLCLSVLLFFSKRAEPFVVRYNQELCFALVAFTFGVFIAMATSVVANTTQQLLLYSALVQTLSVTFVYLAMRMRFGYAAFLGWSGFFIELFMVLVLTPADPFSLAVICASGLGSNAVGMLGNYVIERLSREHMLNLKTIERQRARTEQLLLNILPEEIAERLKRREHSIADAFEAATVLFVDIVGFTPLAERMEPESLVGMLNQVFTAFDDLTEGFGVEKIKTIGDAYMVAAGIPQPRADHALVIARLALAMRDYIARVGPQLGEGISVRIGVHSGPVIAGVIGRRRFIYDLWGDTVNTAARMESHGAAGCIQISETTRALLGDAFVVEPRGLVEIKGKGDMQTWWLLGERGAES